MPDVEDRGAPQRVKISEVLGPGKSVLLGMPGAFTPTCNDRHLPGYYKQADKFKALGVDTVAVVTVRHSDFMRLHKGFDQPLLTSLESRRSADERPLRQRAVAGGHGRVHGHRRRLRQAALRPAR